MKNKIKSLVKNKMLLSLAVISRMKLIAKKISKLFLSDEKRNFERLKDYIAS